MNYAIFYKDAERHCFYCYANKQETIRFFTRNDKIWQGKFYAKAFKGNYLTEEQKEEIKKSK